MEKCGIMEDVGAFLYKNHTDSARSETYFTVS